MHMWVRNNYFTSLGIYLVVERTRRIQNLATMRCGARHHDHSLLFRHRQLNVSFRVALAYRSG
jgi:hypothetical protein